MNKPTKQELLKSTEEVVLEFDHNMTAEIICPHCGYEHGDSWELHGEDGVQECVSCKKEFEWERFVEVTYSTEKTKGNR